MARTAITAKKTPARSGAWVDVRKELIAGFDKAVAEMTKAEAAYDSVGEAASDRTIRSFENSWHLLRRLREVYCDDLPRVAISRCPYSGEVFRWPIDTGGFDGPWWNSESPVRPVHEAHPTVFSVTGSINLRNRIPRTDFLVRPGPELPYVVPRLLAQSTIKAVLSAIKIGRRQAYVVVYFAEDPPLEIARINEWGLDYYSAETEAGEGYSAQVPDYGMDFDTDIAFYIRTGRLLWIRPDDKELRLRSVVADCPYIGISGRQHPIGMINGKSWNTLLGELPIELSENED